MFAPLIVKPQAKTAAQSGDISAFRRATAYGHDRDIEQAQTSRRAAPDQTGPYFPDSESPGAAWSFSRIPLYPPELAGGSERASPVPARRLPGPIQRKLKVGLVNDPLEHEADRVADQVMRMPDPGAAMTSAQPQVSCKCAACEQEDALHRKEAALHAVGGDAPALVEDVLRAAGESLDPTARAYFEPRFGRDLGDVRVSADATAARSAAAVGARAYTVGKRISFAAGEYAPGTTSGRRLLAHELAHVIQQSGGGPAARPAILRRAPDKYVGLTIDQLRKLVREGDKGAAEALYARYEAMTPGQLAQYAKGSDQIAQAVYAKKVVPPKAAAGQGKFSKAGVRETLAKDIAANRTATGIRRREPSAVTPDIDVEGGTVGAARTDIPGLENRVFTGQSKRADGPGYNPESSFPPATDVQDLPHTHAHAEQHIADQLEKAISELPREQLKGRTVWMLIEQEPCATCAQGVVNLDTAAGVLKKLSLKYPELTFEIKNLQSSGLIVLRGTESAAVAASRATAALPGGTGASAPPKSPGRAASGGGEGALAPPSGKALEPELGGPNLEGVGRPPPEAVGPEVFGPETEGLLEGAAAEEAAAGEAVLGSRAGGLAMLLGMVAGLYLYGALSESREKLKKMLERYEKKRRQEIQQQLLKAADVYMKDHAGRILHACWIDKLKALEKAGKQIYVRLTMRVEFENIGRHSKPKSVSDLMLHDTQLGEVEVTDGAQASSATPLTDTGEKSTLFKNEIWEQTVSFSLPAPKAAELEKEFGKTEDQQTCAEAKACFIATACYGSSDGEDLDVLRAFRDQVLANSSVGRSFVRMYYRHSPPVANWLSAHPVARVAVRDWLIKPLVDVVRPLVSRRC
jgi:hypothetical protein